MSGLPRFRFCTRSTLSSISSCVVDLLGGQPDVLGPRMAASLARAVRIRRAWLEGTMGVSTAALPHDQLDANAFYRSVLGAAVATSASK